MRILMICMGNICRSPTAEGVLLHALRANGLDDWVSVDSAGTHAYHVGDPPDARSVRHAAQRGYDLSKLRARRVKADDFRRFDRIYAMDRVNLADLTHLAPRDALVMPRLLLGEREVPDPYSGGPEDFERVLDLVEGAVQGLVGELLNGSGR
jgi:protein-tyrosine phosphatase